MSAARRLRAAVLDDYQGAALRYGPWDRLAGEVEVTCFADHLHDRAALAARLAPFDIVCLMRERTALDAALLDALPNLKLISSTAMWNAALDARHAVARGICVCGTDAVGNGTPELTWLLLLAWARGFARETAAVRAGGWQTGVGVDLHGKTLGILGLGYIGERVARVARAFGMRVLAHSQNLTAERAAQAGAELVPKDRLLAESDVVTIHLKLSERTRHMVGARELALMRPGTFLINTSRGPLVDEAAVIDALASGRLGGYGVDAYDVEPLPAGHPFRTLPNVVATPHIGYVTERAYRLFFTQTVENIRAWLDGRPLRLMGAAA
ncbi:MAG: D-2-hydroxyacid dehydrogenase family protein [Burkholderiales bacterium]|nr:D-2-hydroxyacid dehydrogenase family protein [Burkholderiales bacterium]